jgi:adenylate cyclase class 2
VSGEQLSNIEIKARCPDLTSARERAREAGAELHAVERQRDTYFRCREGRLKLREIRTDSGRRAELISYRRPDCTGPRASLYMLTKVRLPWLRRRWLALTRGITVEVKKRREILLWRGVRIHLDEVAGLGTFLELEAVVRHIGGEDEAERRCRRMADILGIREADQIEISYSDMIAATR